MADLRARLAALMLAVMALVAGSLPGSAQSYEQALAGFAADSFSDTDAAITGRGHQRQPPGGQDHRRAAGRPAAVQSRRQEDLRSRAAGALLDAATGQPAAGVAVASLKTVRLNNRLRRSVEAALGSLTLLAPDPNRRFEAAQAVFKSRDANALPALEGALAKETDARVKRAMQEARAAIVLMQAGSSDVDKLEAIAVIRERSDQDARALLGGLPRRSAARRTAHRGRGHRRHRPASGAMGDGAASLVRPVAGLRAAAGGHRPRHHLRRDGRHQHGARRDGDAGRLHHLRGAGDHPDDTRRVSSTTRWRSRSLPPFLLRAWSASPSSAASSASSTAGRWRRCSPPGASA